MVKAQLDISTASYDVVRGDKSTNVTAYDYTVEFLSADVFFKEDKGVIKYDIDYSNQAIERDGSLKTTIKDENITKVSGNLYKIGRQYHYFTPVYDEKGVNKVRVVFVEPSYLEIYYSPDNFSDRVYDPVIRVDNIDEGILWGRSLVQDFNDDYHVVYVDSAADWNILRSQDYGESFYFMFAHAETYNSHWLGVNSSGGMTSIIKDNGGRAWLSQTDTGGEGEWSARFNFAENTENCRLSPAYDTGLSATMGGDDRIHIAGAADRIYNNYAYHYIFYWNVSTSSDCIGCGSYVGNWTKVSDGDSYADTWLDIAADSTDAVYIVITTASNDDIEIFSSKNGWGDSGMYVVHSSTADREPYIFIDSADRIFISWIESGAVKVANSTAGNWNVAWSVNTITDAGANSEPAPIKETDEGHIVILYSTVEGLGHINYSVLGSGEDSWETPDRAWDITHTSDFPAVRILGTNSMASSWTGNVSISSIPVVIYDEDTDYLNFTNLSLSYAGGEPPEDTCDCAGYGNNYEVDLSDACEIGDCDLGTGSMSFINTGSVTCVGVWNLSGLEDVGSDNKLYINNNCSVMIW